MQKGVDMPKKSSEYPEALRVRLTVEQDTFLREAAEIGGVKPSDLVRALIDNARTDQAISKVTTVDTFVKEVAHAIGQ
jgi:uncharacterized protein (DUF1778 family)